MKTTLALLFGFILACQTASFSAERPEYLDSFDPAKGFKPAQRDLTEIFLQLAGSLECYGSPEPYLRHVAEEHNRIEALYRQKFGKAPKSYRPAYITDAYINRLSANWNVLSPKLGLEPYIKDVGHTMRNAIKGTRGTGTIIVDIFNHHQAKVFDSMTGKGGSGADFQTLRSEFVNRVELNKKPADYEGYEVAHRDAVSFSLDIQGTTMKLFKRLDQGLKPADAERVKTVITSIFMDVGEMAQSELQAGVSEWAIGKSSTAAK
jgi:hypothetical protein